MIAAMLMNEFIFYEIHEIDLIPGGLDLQNGSGMRGSQQSDFTAGKGIFFKIIQSLIKQIEPLTFTGMD